jgi:hypothetical protein
MICTSLVKWGLLVGYCYTYDVHTKIYIQFDMYQYNITCLCKVMYPNEIHRAPYFKFNYLTDIIKQ